MIVNEFEEGMTAHEEHEKKKNRVFLSGRKVDMHNRKVLEEIFGDSKLRIDI